MFLITAVLSSAPSFLLAAGSDHGLVGDSLYGRHEDGVWGRPGTHPQRTSQTGREYEPQRQNSKRGARIQRSPMCCRESPSGLQTALERYPRVECFGVLVAKTDRYRVKHVIYTSYYYYLFTTLPAHVHGSRTHCTVTNRYRCSPTMFPLIYE